MFNLCKLLIKVFYGKELIYLRPSYKLVSKRAEFEKIAKVSMDFCGETHLYGMESALKIINFLVMKCLNSCEETIKTPEEHAEGGEK